MRHAGAALAAGRGPLTREVLKLIGLTLLVDGVFVALYYAAGLAAASGRTQIAYTGLWTVATLVVVLRGLGRVRSARFRSRFRKTNE